MSDPQQIIKELKLERASVNGEEITSICPNPSHGDSAPSFGFNYVSGYYNCFGCGLRGRGLMSLMLKMNLSVPDWVVEDHRANIGEVTHKPKTRLGAKKDAYEVRDSWLTFLTANRDGAKAKLAKRMVMPVAVDLFQIGYHKEKDVLFFPVVDRLNHLIGWSERCDAWDFRWKIMPAGVTKSKLLYGEWLIDLAQKNVVYLVEGMVDCLKMWQWGFKAVAVFGNELLKPQAERIAGFADQVILIPDNDKGGLKLRYSAIDQLRGKVKLAGVNLPDGIKDIGQNECTFSIIKDAIKERKIVR